MANKTIAISMNSQCERIASVGCLVIGYIQYRTCLIRSSVLTTMGQSGDFARGARNEDYSTRNDVMLD